MFEKSKCYSSVWGLPVHGWKICHVRSVLVAWFYLVGWIWRPPCNILKWWTQANTISTRTYKLMFHIQAVQDRPSSELPIPEVLIVMIWLIIILTYTSHINVFLNFTREAHGGSFFMERHVHPVVTRLHA